MEANDLDDVAGQRDGGQEGKGGKGKGKEYGKGQGGKGGKGKGKGEGDGEDTDGKAITPVTEPGKTTTKPTTTTTTTTEPGKTDATATTKPRIIFPQLPKPFIDLQGGKTGTTKPVKPTKPKTDKPTKEDKEDAKQEKKDAKALKKLNNHEFFKEYLARRTDVFDIEGSTAPAQQSTTTSSPNGAQHSPSTIKLPNVQPQKLNTKDVVTQEDFYTLQTLVTFSIYSYGKITTNVVKDNSEKYFDENVLYWTDKEVLDCLKLEKPTLSQERLDIFSDPDEQAWYKSFSPYYIAYLVAKSETDVSSKIDVDKLQKKMQEFYVTQEYLHQTMLLFTYAYIERNPEMTYFLKDPAKWIKLYKQYIYSDDFMPNFILAHSNPANTEYYDLHELKAALDILDPTCTASNDVINTLTSAVIHHTSSVHTNETTLNSEIISATVEKILNGVKDSKDEKYASMVKDLITSFGGFSQTCFEISKAVKTIQYGRLEEYVQPGSEQDLLRTKRLLHTKIADYVENIGTKFVDKLKVKAPSFVFTPLFHKFIVATMRTCQVAVVIYGIANWDKLEGYDKALFTFDASSICLDFATCFKAGDNLVTSVIKIGGGYVVDKIGSISSSTTLSQTLKGACSALFTESAAEFVAMRLTPLLLIVTAVKSLIDAIQDIKNKNWGAFAVDLASLGLALASIGLIVAGISWSGPFAVVAGLVMAGLALVKYFFFPEDTPTQKYYKEYLDDDYKIN